MTRRIVVFSFGVFAYGVFLAVFVYSAGFMTGWLVPKSIDSGSAPGMTRALCGNLALLGLFALQHSVMARPGFKRVWTRIVPVEAERSVYVLASSLAMVALFAFWQPMPATVFVATSPLARGLAQGAFLLGIGTILYSTFLIDHFDLFGLRQAWLALRAIPYTHRPFATPGLYRHVRHPLYVGWFLFFWATPQMSIGHLLMAAGTTAYILVAIVFEERDLLGHFGADYRAWRARTPLFVPRWPGRGRARKAGRLLADLSRS